MVVVWTRAQTRSSVVGRGGALVVEGGSFGRREGTVEE